MRISNPRIPTLLWPYSSYICWYFCESNWWSFYIYYSVEKCSQWHKLFNIPVWDILGQYKSEITSLNEYSLAPVQETWAIHLLTLRNTMKIANRHWHEEISTTLAPLSCSHYFQYFLAWKRDGTNSHHSTLSDSDTSSCFGTTKLDQIPIFFDDHSACDVAYEGANFFKFGDRKGMRFLHFGRSLLN